MLHAIWFGLALMLAGGAMAAPAEDWIAREKIRAGWIYYGDGADRLAFFKQVGMNTLITHAGNAETFTLWAKAAKRAGMRLFGVVGASVDGQKAGMRRCVFGNGYESILPCPLDERYWSEVLTARAVQLAAEGKREDEEISGILIDWEMYANSNKGGQIYYTDACYCDGCFGGFLQAKGQPDVCAAVPLKDRVKWLKDHKLAEEYQPHLQQQVRTLAARMRVAVETVHPDFFLGFYPVPHNWHLVGVAQGLGTREHPMILWATSTYGGGGPAKIPDDWRQQYEQQGVHCYYSGGMLLRMYSAANLAKNMFDIARKTNGYWLFTVHTLCIRPEEQSGDYYLCAGSPEDYLQAIKLANGELDKLGAERDYLTPLELVTEPVRYRNTGFDVGRYRAPTLSDHSTAAHGAALPVPPLPLTVGQHLLMALQPGEEPTLKLEVNQNKAGDIWGVSYSVLDPRKQVLGSGTMPPGEPFALTFKAQAAGLHTVVLTAGYYGRCTVVSSTVPYALWTGDRFEVSGPGGTLYQWVPAGVQEFTVAVQCLWGTTQVKLSVLGPDGQTVAEQETDPYVRSLKLTVPTAGKTGRLWALRLAPVAGKGFRNVQVTLDKALPAAVTMRPDFVFAP